MSVVLGGMFIVPAVFVPVFLAISVATILGIAACVAYELIKDFLNK